MYDLIILGGGPAGYNAAERAAEAGMTVALFEAKNVGGTCLNEGCIPSKALLYSAKIKTQAEKGAAYGVNVKDITIDHEFVIERKRQVVKFLTTGVAKKLKKLGVQWIVDYAVIKGKKNGQYVVRAAERDYRAPRLLIATGSEAFVPPISGMTEGIERAFVLTSREALDLTAVPKHLVVIGGGVIGLEMATYYKAAGSRVTVVEMLDHIGGPQEPEIADILRSEIEKLDIEVLTEHQVMAIGDGQISCQHASIIKQIDCDRVLVSVGRRPNTTGIGLESLGVLTERGAVVTDNQLKTNLSGVYAAGDVNGRSMLAHTAYREAEVAVNHMLGIADKMDYMAIPNIIYTNPEVSSVGITEQMAKDRQLDYVVKQLNMRYAGRYEAENQQGKGICKMIVDRRRQTILGVHMIGNHSSELIWGVDALLNSQMRIDDIKRIVFPHPTVSEIIREAVFYPEEA